MATGSDLTTGVLTGAGTQDVIYTGAGTWEWVGVLFRNYSGVDRNLKIFLNGTAAKDAVFDEDLATKESIYFQCKLGSGDVLRAEGDSATSISWFSEKDSLT